jgi:hypothetical protein
VACWTVSIEPPYARSLAFGFALLAAMSLGDWLIALAGEDPFAVLRTLPVGVLTVWGARVSLALVAAAGLVAAQASAGHSLTPPAFHLFLTWTAAATAAIALLGVHYGLTLFPRAEVAQRIYTLALGISVAASLMIPLLGWIVLLAALIHSTWRLPRWSRLEESS